MLLVLHPEQYNINNILFSDKTKNNILNDGDFYRLYYSVKELTTNGLFIKFSLKNVKVEKYFNKIKCIFDKNSNRRITSFIRSLENNILTKLNIKHKRKILRIEEQLGQNYIKIFTDRQECTSCETVEILLKISGIWADNDSYGITFRFFFV